MASLLSNYIAWFSFSLSFLLYISHHQEKKNHFFLDLGVGCVFIYYFSCWGRCPLEIWIVHRDIVRFDLHVQRVSFIFIRYIN